MGIRNYLARSASQTEESGHAILVDSAHRFQLVFYFVDPAEQVRQLAGQGFEEIRVLDHWGEEREENAGEINRSAHVHYLARKTAGCRGLQRCGNCVGSLLLHAIKVRPGADKERLARGGGRGHAAGFELAFTQHFELPPGGERGDFALLVARVDAAVGVDG